MRIMYLAIWLLAVAISDAHYTFLERQDASGVLPYDM